MVLLENPSLLISLALVLLYELNLTTSTSPELLIYMVELQKDLNLRVAEAQPGKLSALVVEAGAVNTKDRSSLNVNNSMQ